MQDVETEAREMERRPTVESAALPGALVLAIMDELGAWAIGAPDSNAAKLVGALSDAYIDAAAQEEARRKSRRKVARGPIGPSIGLEDHALHCLQQADALLWQARGLLQAAQGEMERQAFPALFEQARMARKPGDEGMTMESLYRYTEEQVASYGAGARVALALDEVARLCLTVHHAASMRTHELRLAHDAERAERQ